MKSFARQFALVLILFPTIAFAQLESARPGIERIVRHARGQIGVAIVDLDNGDTLTFNGDRRFPMQSVFKFPIALAMLSRVDKGTFTLDQTIHLTRQDLRPDTWSPLGKKYPAGNVDVSLDELLAFTVSQSDNNGCDLLLRLLGGPSAVDDYIRSIGITGIAVAATEEEMRQGRDVQYRNWSSPAAMSHLLRTFYSGSILASSTRDYLWRLMAESPTGPKRIKGLLPAGTIVAHKTGSSATDEKGIAAATNDVGIIELPHNRHVAIAVFVTESDAGEHARDQVIARIARAVWDAYSRR